MRKISMIGALAAFSLLFAGCIIYEDSGWDDRPDFGGAAPGWDCNENADCAAGCYCSTDGYCEEAGFCDDASQCPDGWECDDRDSCVPPGTVEGCDVTGCENEDEVCDEETNECVPVDQSFCQAELNAECGAAPACALGSSAEIEDGCYTGECIPNNECSDGAPCSQLVGEGTCGDREDCSKVFRGLNCTDPGGLECDEDEANCTCESFEYDHCEAAS
jgi:hypothetical protein